MTQNINPRTWNAEVVETAKKRGRKPGQLKGTKYNVVQRKPVTIGLPEAVLEELNRLCEELQINRSQIVTKCIQTWIMEGSKRNFVSYETFNGPNGTHLGKRVSDSKRKKTISINLPQIAFMQIEDKRTEWNKSRSDLLGSVVEDCIARGAIPLQEVMA